MIKTFYKFKREKFKLLLAAFLSLIFLNNTAIAIDIIVSGSSAKQAFVEINGKLRVLKIGQTSPEGVKLISVSNEAAILKVDGVESEYLIGSAQISSSYSKPETVTVQVYKDQGGMFTTTGAINDYPVSFLVDTGATIVAMNANEAKRLGIDYLVEGQKGVVNTASGNAVAYYLRLKTVAVGRIKLRNIEAVVIDGSHPTEVLLGMSFLGQLKVQHQGSVMQLETK